MVFPINFNDKSRGPIIDIRITKAKFNISLAQTIIKLSLCKSTLLYFLMILTTYFVNSEISEFAK